MFSLQNQKAKLSSVNPRAEIHGQDRRMAVDLKFEVKLSNDCLSEFDPSLKSAIYRAADPGEGDLLANEPGNLPKLKFPLMGAIKWDKAMPGYETVIHYGVSGQMDIHLIETDVDGFRFDCQDGGTVAVSFRVIAHPEAEQLGRLCEMIQQEVEMSLIEPAPESLSDVFKEAA